MSDEVSILLKFMKQFFSSSVIWNYVPFKLAQFIWQHKHTCATELILNRVCVTLLAKTIDAYALILPLQLTGMLERQTFIELHGVCNGIEPLQSYNCQGKHAQFARQHTQKTSCQTTRADLPTDRVFFKFSCSIKIIYMKIACVYLKIDLSSLVG